jgi:hypothetical protein
MIYEVLKSFKVRTLQREMQLNPGQVITLPHDKVIKLLNEGKITPVGKVAYKVYSEILQGYLWVVDTDEDMHSLRSQGINEAIYTGDEIKKLKDIDKDALKDVHKIKEVFDKSVIEEVREGGNEKLQN